MNIIITLFFMLIFSINLIAQAPVLNASSILRLGQRAPSLTVIQTYVYKYYLDDNSTGIILSGVNCKQNGPVTTEFSCFFTIPSAITPGPHTIAVSAMDANGESTKTEKFSFTFTGGPLAPFYLGQ